MTQLLMVQMSVFHRRVSVELEHSTLETGLAVQSLKEVDLRIRTHGPY